MKGSKALKGSSADLGQEIPFLVELSVIRVLIEKGCLWRRTIKSARACRTAGLLCGKDEKLKWMRWEKGPLFVRNAKSVIALPIESAA